MEKQITEAELEGQYSEGESGDGDKGYGNAADSNGGYTEGEYSQDGRGPGNLTGSADGSPKARKTGERDETDGQDAMDTAAEEMRGGRGNFVSRFFEEKNRKKEKQRQEMERVLSALAAISEDAEVSISPDHKPGEKLVREPEKEGKENSAEKRTEGAVDDGRKPLHNPLPVPKKKAATMLDYDYEVSDDDDYDYD